jgi:acyl-CoA thioester hydrolase
MFTHLHRVRSHEVDTQGFLFNSRYLEIADVAMTEFFRSIGYPYPDLVSGGTDPSVVSAALSFQAPAYFDDILNVSVVCSRVGSSSFQLDLNLSRGDTKVADITLVYVNVDPGTARSRPLQAQVADALRSNMIRATPASTS